MNNPVTTNEAGSPKGSEVPARRRSREPKPKKPVVKCGNCAGTGEIKEPDRRAVRCPVCLGSGIGLQSENRQLDAFVFGH